MDIKHKIKFPFDTSTVKNFKSYVEKMLNVFEEVGELDVLALYEESTVIECIIDFGSPSSIHILHFFMSDLAVLMTPENNGWTTQRVYLGSFEGYEKIAEKHNLELLFTYPNPEYGVIHKPYEFEGETHQLVETEKVYVYADRLT